MAENIGTDTVIKMDEIYEYCDRELIDFFLKFRQSNKQYFNITISDIDNLGLCCAKTGRAITQNAVDFVICIIRNQLNNYIDFRYETEMYLSPSGEEVCIFSFSDKADELITLPQFLSVKVNLILETHKISSEWNIRVSFAGKNILRDDVIKDLEIFLKLAKQDDKSKSIEFFYDMLYKIRKQVEMEMDFQKFNILIDSKPRYARALRNYVYYKVIKHKEDIHINLPIFNKLLKANKLNNIDVIVDSYGIDEEKSNLIKEIITSTKTSEL